MYASTNDRQNDESACSVHDVPTCPHAQRFALVIASTSSFQLTRRRRFDGDATGDSDSDDASATPRDASSRASSRDLDARSRSYSSSFARRASVVDVASPPRSSRGIAAGELVPHAELRSIHLAPQPEDEGASTAASSSADGPSNGGLLARTLSSLRRNLVPDDERVIALREQLATAASERDHARRERDQALRLVDNLRKQLHEERAASASATS